jgi:hypothetical protein
VSFRVRGLAWVVSMVGVLGGVAPAMAQAVRADQGRPGSIAPGGLHLPQITPSWPQTNAIKSVAQAQREAAQARPVTPTIPITGPSRFTTFPVGTVAGDSRIFAADGFGADARFTNDRFRLAAHLGEVTGPSRFIHQRPFPRPFRHHHFGRGFFPFQPFGFFGYNSGAYINFVDGYSSPWLYPPEQIGYGYGPVDPWLYQQIMPPAAPAQPPPRVLTVLEQATEDFQTGRLDEAISAYRRHLTSAPADAPVLRLLAVALLANGQVKEGIATIGLAYRTDPALASRPVDKTVLPDGDDTLRSLVTRAVTYANNVKTGSAWLMVASLMQAQGRADYAAKMIDRAKAAGLESVVAEKFDAALMK